MGKTPVKATGVLRKHVGKPSGDGSERQNVAWMFDRLDRDGPFAFDIERGDFDARLILGKIMDYSSMRWCEVRRQTHNRGKSKHHFLDGGSLSDEAKERIKKLGFEKETDAIFSFSFGNLLRIIGIREGYVFHAVWFDPDHRFCHSSPIVQFIFGPYIHPRLFAMICNRSDAVFLSFLSLLLKSIRQCALFVHDGALFTDSPCPVHSWFDTAATPADA